MRVDVVEADVVVMGLAGTVAPGPADGDRRVVEVEDVVVLDHVVVASGRSTRRPPAGACRPPWAIRHSPHRVVRGDLFRVVLGDPAIEGRCRRVADLDAAGRPGPPARSSRRGCRGSRPRRPSHRCRRAARRSHRSTRCRAPTAEIAPSRFTSDWPQVWPSGGMVQLAWANVRPRNCRCCTQRCAAGLPGSPSNTTNRSSRGAMTDARVGLLARHRHVGQLAAGPIEIPTAPARPALRGRYRPGNVRPWERPRSSASGYPRKRDDVLGRIDRVDAAAAWPSMREKDLHFQVAGGWPSRSAGRRRSIRSGRATCACPSRQAEAPGRS